VIRLGNRMEHAFRPHPIPRSHDNEFSVRRDHHAIDDTRRHIDSADHRRLPNVGLVQFRPGLKLGGNDFFAGPESLIEGSFQFFADWLARQLSLVCCLSACCEVVHS